jgi:hypothetical protein
MNEKLVGEKNVRERKVVNEKLVGEIRRVPGTRYGSS